MAAQRWAYIGGPIKSYDSLDDILEEANYWKDIPLEERVALEIDHPGKHYFIASVEFENGTSGIYSGVMDVNAIGLKPSPSDSIQFKLDSADISSGVVKSRPCGHEDQQAGSGISTTCIQNHMFRSE